MCQPPPKPSRRPQYVKQDSTESSKSTDSLESKDSTASNSPPPDLAEEFDFSVKPPPRPAKRPIHIQPADPDPPAIKTKSDLQTKLENLDLDGKGLTQEKIAVFESVKQKLDEEGPYGETAKSLKLPHLLSPRNPALDLRPNESAIKSANNVDLGSKMSALKTSENELERKLKDLKVEGEHNLEKEPKENADSESASVPPKETERKDSTEHKIQLKSESLPRESTLVETEPVESEPETDPVETDPVETDPVQTDPVETDSVESKKLETKKPEVKESSESTKLVESEALSESIGPKEHVEAEHVETGPVKSKEPETKETVETEPEEVKHVESTESLEPKESESKDPSKEPVETKETVESLVSKERVSEERISKDLEESTELPKSTEPVESKEPPKTEEFTKPLESKSVRSKPVESKPVESKPASKPAKPEIPDKPIFKTRGAFASKFEAALREQEAPKPKPILRTRTQGNDFSSRFNNLSEILSKGPENRKNSQPSEDKTETASEKSNEKSSEDQPMGTGKADNESESVDVQLRAMPKTTKRRPGPRGKRLPTAAKPKFTIETSQQPLWTFEFRVRECNCVKYETRPQSKSDPETDPELDENVENAENAEGSLNTQSAQKVPVRDMESVPKQEDVPKHDREPVNNQVDELNYNVKSQSPRRRDHVQFQGFHLTGSDSGDSETGTEHNVNMPHNSASNSVSPTSGEHLPMDPLNFKPQRPSRRPQIPLKKSESPVNNPNDDNLHIHAKVMQPTRSPSQTGSTPSLDNPNSNESADSGESFHIMGSNTELNLRQLLEKALEEKQSSPTLDMGKLDLPPLRSLVDQNPSPSADEAEVDPFNSALPPVLAELQEPGVPNLGMSLTNLVDESNPSDPDSVPLKRLSQGEGDPDSSDLI